MKSLVLGAFALDDISLPRVQLTNVVGGAAVYGALASSIFAPTGIGGMVGNDFPSDFIKSLDRHSIDTTNIQKSEEPSFRWKAMYSADLNILQTTYQKMNAARFFDIKALKVKNRPPRVVFLANLDPELQLRMAHQVVPTSTILLDSMDLWIVEKRDLLKEVLKMVDVYFVSEDEARLLVGRTLPVHELIDEIMQLGPRVVILKKGRHGLTMYGELGTISIPSYPLVHVLDPSGAGDTLAGAAAGVLARLGKLDFDSIVTALLLGSTVSSFVVEGYTIDPILRLSLDEVLNRADLYLQQLPNRSNLLFDRI